MGKADVSLTPLSARTNWSWVSAYHEAGRGMTGIRWRAISRSLMVGGWRRGISAEFWDVDEWQRIRRIRVKVWPQAVRRHTPAEKVTDRDDRLRRWNFHLNAIQPAPNMHLADLGIRDALTNTARQMRLATGHFDCLNEGFF